MLVRYHARITTQALADWFSPLALEVIIAANLHQDAIQGQIGHPEFHFDDNAFERGYAYQEAQRVMIQQISKRAGDLLPAWRAFGRLIHAAQDFYAHSNYLALWARQFPTGEPLPPPAQVLALEEDLLAHPELCSGRIYPAEMILWVLPFLKNWLYPRLPADSHAKMNLDYPERGPLFPYALEAARQRTVYEVELLAERLSRHLGDAAWERFQGS